jgi:electron transfer flavoprotein alpha subunit
MHKSKIIENRKFRATAHANQEITIMFWEVGQHINAVVLGNKRAEYGKQIMTTLSILLVKKYGNSFEYTKLTRMAKFAELFPDKKILATLSQHLSWSHFVEILPIKSAEARLYYAQDAASRQLGIRELRNQISRKVYERREIANAALTEKSRKFFTKHKSVWNAENPFQPVKKYVWIIFTIRKIMTSNDFFANKIQFGDK